jgi:tRNA (guanine-N1)-methyltransferase
MVLRADVVVPALESVRMEAGSHGRVLFPSPDGAMFSQRLAERLAKEPHLIMICGHYEGLDQRIRDHWVDEEISLGDFVLTGGEIPALAIIDSVARLVPGVLGNPKSGETESHGETGLLDHVHYTRPPVFRDFLVPSILQGGHHREVEAWRRANSLERTRTRRPDLYVHSGLGGDGLMRVLRATTPDEKERATAQGGQPLDCFLRLVDYWFVRDRRAPKQIVVGVLGEVQCFDKFGNSPVGDWVGAAMNWSSTDAGDSGQPIWSELRSFLTHRGLRKLRGGARMLIRVGKGNGGLVSIQIPREIPASHWDYVASLLMAKNNMCTGIAQGIDEQLCVLLGQCRINYQWTPSVEH